MPPDRQTARVERLRTGAGERLRSVRLRALQDAPDAFGTTYAEAAAEPLESWEAQVRELGIFVAMAGGGDVGLIRGAPHDEIPARDSFETARSALCHRRGNTSAKSRWP